MTQDQKQFLRQEALRNRAMMNTDTDSPEAVIDLFFDAIKPEKNKVISFYAPVNKEFDCWPLMEAAFDRGFTCALPIIEKGTKVLRFGLWDPMDELEEGPYGIPQPDTIEEGLEPDIVITPLLAFDRRGYRLGMGGGYYDTTLNVLRQKKKIIAVGVAHAQQACLFNLPNEEHDQKLEWVITPQGTHYFGD